MRAPFAQHVLQQTVVLPEHRLLFLPVPKAGCTSVLWRLADVAGITPGEFERSTLPEVSPAMTVHDMSVWRPEHRLAHYEGGERDRVLEEPGWLRFTLVRHPATRLWSAWQSKLLLREPRFVEAFGAAPWFPRVPERPADVVEDFRRFVAALAGGDADDVHWAVQAELVDQLPLTHVGKVERIDETLTLLPGRAAAVRENRSPLPMPPNAYDADAAGVLAERYARDFRAFGYDVAPPAGPRDWEDRVTPLLPLLRASIAERARLGQLHRLARRRGERVRAVEERLEAASTRQATHSRSPVLANIERHTDYDVRWAWAEAEPRPGFTAVLRVRDEARSLPLVLPPLLRAVDRVLVVDNGSTDGTPDLARAIAAAEGAGDRLELRSYPFPVARCGAEHLATPAASVHSLAHFYNWCFSHVRTAYALKWDGDMVLTETAVGALRALAWQLEAAEAVIRIPRYPLYVDGDGIAFLDTGLRNCEPWAWPNRPGYSFVKAMDWEMPLWGSDVSAITLPDWSCVELKHLDADEFAHWTPTDFGASARTRRKQREWEVFQALAAGREPPEGVVRIPGPLESMLHRNGRP